MTYHYYNKTGRKCSADYFIGNMSSCIPSHISVIYDENEAIVWERK